MEVRLWKKKESLLAKLESLSPEKKKIFNGAIKTE